MNENSVQTIIGNPICKSLFPIQRWLHVTNFFEIFVYADFSQENLLFYGFPLSHDD